MRIGTTSYIYPADILPNVRRLGARVDDIELILFEAGPDGAYLPDAATISQLKDLAHQFDLTYTVHMPLDLRLADTNYAASVSMAIRIIEATRELSPFGYVVHTEGDEVSGFGATGSRPECALSSLARLADALGDPALLCVENLESHPDGFIDAILESSDVSFCADIGHYWKAGADPIPALTRWISRLRVVHLHGVADRDHTSLAVMAAEKVDPVLEILNNRFDGVLTLEVFNETDLAESLHMTARRS